MALWVCSGEAGCGTKYAVGLFRCPRCHNTEFYEDGDPMAKITRHGGASDNTLPTPDEEVAAVEFRGEPGPELVDLPAAPEPEKEGGEEPSPGSSSSASAETRQPNSELSEPQTPSLAPTTVSRSRKGRTGSRSASGTAGGREAGTSETGSADA